MQAGGVTIKRHRQLYGDPTIGGDDPGRGFDDYLADPSRRVTWIAEIQGTPVGMTGLIVHGDQAVVEPVVVAEAFRPEGVARVLAFNGPPRMLAAS